MKTNTALYWMLGAVTCALSQPSVAAENCRGWDVLTTLSSETLDLGKDHTLTVVRQTSALTTENAPIYDQMTGECTGSILSMPGGAVRAVGYCLRHDKDGDTASIEWGVEPGATRGYWKSTAGTGKFAGKADSGWSELVRTDAKIEMVKWGGTCK